jgi:hypothetical protein
VWSGETLYHIATKGSFQARQYNFPLILSSTHRHNLSKCTSGAWKLVPQVWAGVNGESNPHVNDTYKRKYVSCDAAEYIETTWLVKHAITIYLKKNRI